MSHQTSIEYSSSHILPFLLIDNAVYIDINTKIRKKLKSYNPTAYTCAIGGFLIKYVILFLTPLKPHPPYMGQNYQDGKYALFVSLFISFYGDLESK